MDWTITGRADRVEVIGECHALCRVDVRQAVEIVIGIGSACRIRICRGLEVAVWIVGVGGIAGEAVAHDAREPVQRVVLISLAQPFLPCRISLTLKIDISGFDVGWDKLAVDQIFHVDRFRQNPRFDGHVVNSL